MCVQNISNGDYKNVGVAFGHDIYAPLSRRFAPFEQLFIIIHDSWLRMHKKGDLENDEAGGNY